MVYLLFRTSIRVARVVTNVRGWRAFLFGCFWTASLLRSTRTRWIRNFSPFLAAFCCWPCRGCCWWRVLFPYCDCRACFCGSPSHPHCHYRSTHSVSAESSQEGCSAPSNSLSCWHACFASDSQRSVYWVRPWDPAWFHSASGELASAGWFSVRRRKKGIYFFITAALFCPRGIWLGRPIHQGRGIQGDLPIGDRGESAHRFWWCRSFGVAVFSWQVFLFALIIYVIIGAISLPYWSRWTQKKPKSFKSHSRKLKGFGALKKIAG